MHEVEVLLRKVGQIVSDLLDIRVENQPLVAELNSKESEF